MVKKHDRHFDHAVWSFSADKYNPPKLTLNFSKPEVVEQGPDAVPPAHHALGTQRFMQNMHLGASAKGDNLERFGHNGIEEVVVTGVLNIIKLANYLKAHNNNGINDAHLAQIPERLHGTGKDLPGDQYRKEAIAKPAHPKTPVSFEPVALQPGSAEQIMMGRSPQQVLDDGHGSEQQGHAERVAMRRLMAKQQTFEGPGWQSGAASLDQHHKPRGKIEPVTRHVLHGDDTPGSHSDKQAELFGAKPTKNGRSR